MKKKFFLSFRLKEFFFGFAAVVLCIICVCMLDFEYLATVAQSVVPADKNTVIIDAGHGGIDGGTQSESGIIEKNVNLEISLKLKDMLEFSGFDVIMTRESDNDLSDEDAATIREKKSTDLNNRLAIIKNNPDAYFVSIHQNYFTQSKYSGTQVFYSKNNPESCILAQSIQTSVADMLQKDNTRQIKQSGSEIYLLDKAKNVAVMVECGFLSNAKEAELLTNEDYQKKLVMAITDGLMKHAENER